MRKDTRLVTAGLMALALVLGLHSRAWLLATAPSRGGWAQSSAAPAAQVQLAVEGDLVRR